MMYPIGWDNREVRESCGKGANVYNLGEYGKVSNFSHVSRCLTRRESEPNFQFRAPLSRSGAMTRCDTLANDVLPSFYIRQLTRQPFRNLMQSVGKVMMELPSFLVSPRV